MIYLDHNATSPLRPEIRDAMFAVSGEALNPSSIHASGRAARKLVEEARRKILESVNGTNLVFCGTGTEANNLALAQAEKIIISAVEHDSIFKAAKNPVIISVDKNGLAGSDNLKNHLANLTGQGSILISVILANNETGVIQDMKQIVALAREIKALVHTDAIQAYGRVNIDFAALGVDLMTISAHKAGGPVGVAALVHRPDLELKPFLFGGGQEKSKRPGTENVLAIHGFGKLAEIIRKGEIVSRETTDIRNYLEGEIKKAGGKIIAESVNRLPNTSSIIMPGVEVATQLIHFDTEGICVSSGSACSSGKMQVSRVLNIMEPGDAKYAIRVSLGWNSTKSDVERFVAEWKKLYQKNGRKAA